ncbi:XapX domain-containing protein [Povalibacter uvarum]|uniref:XapX domain-containing protein n=1 Tax=Povalibacter uvarum TaxID=732238 RepID=A0A841HKI0_9GAMM|nr:DUF1427 family protein [Povalibacter uvarum]MBB6092889.1 XapX domain-containing protein [Povalibacter uvarum]
MKILAGFVLAFAIGVVCRLTDVPLPAPPVLIGAALVVAMSTGYVLVDRLVARRAASHRDLCGGPTGEQA